MNLKSYLPLLAVLAFLNLGCGESGPANYKLSGTVTYNGSPVPAGEVFLRPVSGPGGYALIQDGKYETIAGRGFQGGPSKITFHGFNGSDSEAEAAQSGGDIFPPYTVEVDLPGEDHVYDLEVPAMRDR